MQVVNYFNILIFNILGGGFLFSCFPFFHLLLFCSLYLSSYFHLISYLPKHFLTD